MKNIKNRLVAFLLPVCFVLLFATNGLSLEFQYQYDIPSMVDRQTAVKIWETVENIKGVLDLDVNLERKYLFVTFDDAYVDEEVIKTALEKAGFKVKRLSLMLEPKEGVMN